MIDIVTGNLFDAKEKYICHQTNCITKRAAHLSKDVFARYPYADIYAGRTEPDEPGNIVIKGNGQDQRYVINLLGQYYPGCKYPYSTFDGSKVREKNFHHCLLRVAKIPNLESVAFPFRIGCGAAGGNWDHYFGTLKNFAIYVEATQKARVVIYQREEDKT